MFGFDNYIVRFEWMQLPNRALRPLGDHVFGCTKL